MAKHSERAGWLASSNFEIYVELFIFFPAADACGLHLRAPVIYQFDRNSSEIGKRSVYGSLHIRWVKFGLICSFVVAQFFAVVFPVFVLFRLGQVSKLGCCRMHLSV